MSLENNSQSSSPVASEPVNSTQMFRQSGTKAENPLAFIQNNLRKPVPDSQVLTPPTPEATKEEPKAPATQTAPEQDFSIPLPELEQATPQEPQVEPEEFPDQPEVEGEVVPLQANYKKLKSAYKIKKEEFKRTAELLAQREAELAEYQTGKKLPETVQSLEEEVNTLRRFQKIVDLKSSPEYQEKHVKPLTNVRNKLEEIFTEYQLPKETLKEVRKFATLADQNEFISDHFDNVGALQVRQLLDAEKEVLTKMQAAEAEPGAELDRLIAEGRQAREVRRRQEKESVRAELRDGWNRSLSKIKEEGVFLELIPRVNDSKYNETIVRPIIKSASAEASKFVEMLFEDGLQKLRPEAAEFIANMTLYGHSSGVNATTRQRALEHAKSLEENTTRRNAIARPFIGNSTGAQAAPSQPREMMTPDKLGGAILNSIASKK